MAAEGDTWVEKEYSVVTVELGGEDFDLRVKRPGPKESVSVISRVMDTELAEMNVAEMSQAEMDTMVSVVATYTLGLTEDDVRELPISTIAELFAAVLDLAGDEVDGMAE